MNGVKAKIRNESRSGIMPDDLETFTASRRSLI
jgi:hypothetical protein